MSHKSEFLPAEVLYFLPGLWWDIPAGFFALLLTVQLLLHKLLVQLIVAVHWKESPGSESQEDTRKPGRGVTARMGLRLKIYLGLTASAV